MAAQTAQAPCTARSRLQPHTRAVAHAHATQQRAFSQRPRPACRRVALCCAASSSHPAHPPAVAVPNGKRQPRHHRRPRWHLVPVAHLLCARGPPCPCLAARPLPACRLALVAARRGGNHLAAGAWQRGRQATHVPAMPHACPAATVMTYSGFAPAAAAQVRAAQQACAGAVCLRALRLAPWRARVAGRWRL